VSHQSLLGEVKKHIPFRVYGKAAALTNLKLDITHPLYRKVKDYRGEVVAELAAGETPDINRPGFRVGDLYKRGG
jgi:hypothetical protein